MGRMASIQKSGTKKLYKILGTCKMCKKRIQIANALYQKHYCDECVKKYFKK